jgi:PAS domain S-box-containing protein
LLFAIYEHLPLLVVQLTLDGVVLFCNPETTKITGYEQQELVGKNLWATLFPGKLFAQVPRFISPIAPSPLLKDTPLTIRTRGGQERVIAFTRFMHAAPVAGEGGVDIQDVSIKTMVCIGADLTDRLLDSDKMNGAEGSGFLPFGPNVGNAGTVEGEIVTPLAISPPAPAGAAGGSGGESSRGTAGSAEAIRSVQEFLAALDARMKALDDAAAAGEVSRLAALAAAISVQARDQIAAILSRAAEMEAQAARSAMGPLVPRVEEIVALYRGDGR